ncbi:small ribosomal subunit protein bS6m [Pogoniulus pusillus]|uniref:small ribosomal subunit protein bS6m n=1 Tax=Pogoniulus pusillus TaxID=488313 RepID=UPI0030B96248
MAVCECNAKGALSQKLPRLVHLGTKAGHLLALQFHLDPLPLGSLHLANCVWVTYTYMSVRGPKALMGPEALGHGRLQKVLEELEMPYMGGPRQHHPCLAFWHRGPSVSLCHPLRCQPIQVRLDDGRRPAAMAGGACEAGQPQPPPLRREGGRRAQAPSRRRGEVEPQPRELDLVPLSGGYCPRSCPQPIPPGPGRRGSPWATGNDPPAGGRVRGRRCLARARGGAAEPAQLLAPFKPHRPPGCLCSLGAARVGAAASTACRRGRAFLLRSPISGITTAPSSPPSAPPHPRSSRHSSKMPRYELALILKAMQRPETAAVLKRTVEALMERGAIVRNLENLGERSLPYRISKHKEHHRRGGYFLIDLEAPPSIVSPMMDHLGRDIDVIRPAFIKHLPSKTEECSGIVPANYEDKLTAKKK